MIKQAVKNWEERKQLLRESFMESRPSSYTDIVRRTIEVITDEEYEDFSPDPERIHVIDDGDYQGTIVFVIAQKGYQPDKYYFIMMSYGSCSYCDTFQSISDRYYDDDDENKDAIIEEQVNGYMTLALHVVQNLKVMGGNE